MKKITLLSFFALMFCAAQAQLKIGAGLTLTPDIGATIKAQTGITDDIDASVLLTYFFVDSGVDLPGFSSSASVIMIELNGQYNFEIGDGFKVYPLVGLNVGLISASFEGPGIPKTSSSDTDIGLNLGGGVNYALGSFDLWAEAKIVIGGIDDFVLQAGVLFPLGS